MVWVDLIEGAGERKEKGKGKGKGKGREKEGKVEKDEMCVAEWMLACLLCFTYLEISFLDM